MTMTRMPGRNFLFVPGPTNVPDRVQRAMMVAMEDHRSSKFPDLTKGLFEDLKKVLKTETGQVIIFPASGTAGWEAASTNTLSPGDKVLACRHGMFSHRWIDMCKRHGLDVDAARRRVGRRRAARGRSRPRSRADKDHEIKAVLVTHNETATGVPTDVAAVRKAMDAAKHPALLFVDGVSSIACMDFRMDEWGVDVAVTRHARRASCCRPASPSSASARRRSPRMETAKLPRCFLDFARHAQHANPRAAFPYTPPVNAPLRPRRVART